MHRQKTETAGSETATSPTRGTSYAQIAPRNEANLTPEDCHAIGTLHQQLIRNTCPYHPKGDVTMQSNRPLLTHMNGNLPFTHEGLFYAPTTRIIDFPNSPTLRKWNCYNIPNIYDKARLILCAYLPDKTTKEDVIKEFANNMPKLISSFPRSL